jgi:hypothetical protein
MTHPLFHAQSSVRRFGGIVPSVSDWLSRIRPETWMSRGYSFPVGEPAIREVPVTQ